MGRVLSNWQWGVVSVGAVWDEENAEIMVGYECVNW